MAIYRYNIYQGPKNAERAKDIYRVFKSLQLAAEATKTFDLASILRALAENTREVELEEALKIVADKVGPVRAAKKASNIQEAFALYPEYFNSYVLKLLSLYDHQDAKLYENLATYVHIQSV